MSKSDAIRSWRKRWTWATAVAGTFQSRGPLEKFLSVAVHVYRGLGLPAECKAINDVNEVLIRRFEGRDTNRCIEYLILS